jgi:hypothetical protein
MRKIRVLFVLLFCAVPLVAQQDEEEMFNLPINEFTLGTVDENALLSADPQALKLYEAAVNAEKQPGVFKIPGPAVEAWQEVTKITQGNPFLQVAQKRLGEWKILTDFYEKHKANFDKLKLLFASPALPAAQKSSLASKYLEEFGVTFGTSGIMNLISTVSDKNEITGNDAFKAKIQETKQKRCDLGSGRDCYDLGKNFLTIEYEKMMMFNKACELKYQPGCDAQQKKAEPVAAQTEEKPEKTYAFAEDPVGLLPPFAEAGDATKQGADPEVLKLYEAAAALEKEKGTLSKPSAAVAAWESVEKAAGKNPFQPLAQQRTADWKKAAADLDARDAALAELEKNIADNSIESSRKAELMSAYLNKHGVVFGTMNVLGLIAPQQNQGAPSGDLYQNYAFYMSEAIHKEIANNESFKAKVKETVNKRCELKSGADCRVYAENHAADETEKAAYLKKACDFGVQETCSLQVADAPQQVEKENAMSSEEEDKFKAELNQAGRRTRIAVAATTLAVGVVAGGLGGWSFYEMSKAEKDRKKYFDKYNELGEGEPFSLFAKYRKKAENADKKRKKYLILGSVGVGVGAALIATGVTLFCIDFKGEKEVKKKYNVSLGANPLEGTVQFALNW